MLFDAIKSNLTLSLPILLTRLIGIGSNLFAMILIAKLGTDALSASALIMGIFGVCVLLLMSFSFSICALIAEANAKQQLTVVGTIIRSSIFLNSLLAIPFLFCFYYLKDILTLLNQPPIVAKLTGEYFRGIVCGYLPLLWTNIIEQFFIGINKPRYIVYLSIFSLIVTPLISYVFIFGKFGLPAWGMFGAGLAVSFTAIINLLFLCCLIFAKEWQHTYGWLNFRNIIDVAVMKKLFQLGWPIALQYGGEFSAYILITLMMGWVSVIALAAQQIVLQFTSIVVMIPTSISQATSVLVAQARAKSDYQTVKYQVNISLLIVGFSMFCIAVVYFIFPETLAQLYLKENNSDNFNILAIVKILLMITAVSQLFDGAKNVLSGAYRGMQETKIPMLITTLSLWLISIPLAYLLGLILNYGAAGIRLGFACGMIIASSILMLRWFKKSYVKPIDELIFVLEHDMNG